MGLFASLLRDRRGATAIEYCLIAAFISLSLIFAAQAIGLDLSNVFNTVGNAMEPRA